MKLLVVGGMHGNEPLGIDLVRRLIRQPIKNVDAVLANEIAVTANQRFLLSDMNRSFPGDARSETYELKRPTELLKLAKKYDVVLDFHNTHCPDNDCGFVGQTAVPLLYSVAEHLGLRRIIVADYNCINKYAQNCLSVEISLGSSKMNLEWWCKQLAVLTAGRRLGSPSAAKRLDTYGFVYRMTIKDRDRLGLENEDLRAFVPIRNDLAASMGVKSPAYPIFIADEYTPYNYGGLLNKFNV